MHEKALSQDDLNNLPIVDIPDSKEGFVYEKLVCNNKGEVVGKLADFNAKKDYRYFKVYEPEVFAGLHTEVEDSNPKVIKFKAKTDPESYMFTPMAWSEISAKRFPAEQWRVRGLIPRQGLVIIASPSGERKTWFALELVKAMSTGQHFLTHDGFPTLQSKVLYLDGELTPPELQSRGKRLGFDAIPTKNEPLFVTNQNIDLLDAKGFGWLETMLEAEKIDVLFIDTLRAVVPGMNEDKAEEVRAFFKQFNPLKNKGLCIVVLDHCRKPMRGEGPAAKKEQLLGSQDKVANAEVVLMLRSNLHYDYFSVQQVKNRVGKELKSFNVGMRDIVATNAIELNYEGEFDEQVFKVDQAKLCIPQFIGGGEKTTAEIVAIMKADNDIAERNTKDALRELVKSGVLIAGKQGRSFTYRLGEHTLPLPTGDRQKELDH